MQLYFYRINQVIREYYKQVGKVSQVLRGNPRDRFNKKRIIIVIVMVMIIRKKTVGRDFSSLPSIVTRHFQSCQLR